MNNINLGESARNRVWCHPDNQVYIFLVESEIFNLYAPFWFPTINLVNTIKTSLTQKLYPRIVG